MQVTTAPTEPTGPPPMTGWWPHPRPAEIGALAALVLVGLAGRFVLATRSGLWRDEGTFLFTLQQPTIAAMLDFLRLLDSHPPLHYLVSRAWAAVFGHGETAALAFPVLLGVLLIPAIWAVGTKLLGPRTGLVAAAIVALSPGLGEVSALVRPYAWMTLLTLFSIATLWQALVRGKPRDWGLHALATLAMLLSHNWAFLVWGAQILAVGGWAMYGQDRPVKDVLKPYALALCAVVVGYAWWLPAMLEQLAHAGHSIVTDMWAAGVVPTIANHMRTYLAVGLGFVPEVVHPPFVGLLVLVIGIAFVPLPGRVEQRGEGLALWLLLAVPLGAFGAAIVLSGKTNLLITHCFSIVAPCVVLLLAHGATVIAGAWQAMGWRGSANLVLALLVVGYGAVMRDGWLVMSASAKSNARDVAAFVTRHARPDDLVIVAPIWEASSFNFYFRLPNDQRDYPDAVRRGEVSFNQMGPRMASEQAIIDVRAAIDQARARGRRVWFVTEPGYAADSDRVDDKVALPPDYQVANYNSVAHWRTSQVLRHLKKAYGPPALSSPEPTYYFMPYESQAAHLFTPNAAD